LNEHFFLLNGQLLRSPTPSKFVEKFLGRERKKEKTTIERRNHKTFTGKKMLI
jgi:hypothetical protein